MDIRFANADNSMIVIETEDYKISTAYPLTNRYKELVDNWLESNTISPYEDPVDYIELMRLERNRLLAESDWTQLDDTPVSNKLAWATYRQALRDLPDSYSPTSKSEYDSIEWPTPPEE